MKGMKLLTAMGSPVLVWEMVDFFNNDRCRYNERAEGVRERCSQGRRLRQLHLLCTGSVMEKARTLREELSREYSDLVVDLVLLACDDIGCDRDDADMREIVYKAVARLAGPDLIIASGGRKTITQRLMEAAIMHGCAGYLTITAPDGVEREIKNREDASRRSSELNVLWTPAASFYREKRERIVRDEIGDTFRSLYMLPNWLVERLRENRIGADAAFAEKELVWLRHLPKADLHCHLGGCYDFSLLRELAETLLDDLGITVSGRERIAGILRQRLGPELAVVGPRHLRRLHPVVIHCLANLDILTRDIDPAPHVAHAVFVAALSDEQLRGLAADGGDIPSRDLDWYMKSGDLGGSNLLQTENTLCLAVRRAIFTAAADGVRYLEIRFSPGNYTRAGLGIDKVVGIVTDEADRVVGRTDMDITVNFLVMATRHKDREEMQRHVAAAVAAFSRDHDGSRVVGFDLAGQEEDNPPENFMDTFEPLHEKFVNITIHAGEMDTQEKIWQAIYRLHARRIGHGLKLVDNPAMMDSVRDWGIAIEMCPSSNRQTNGFRFFDGEDTGPEYPLKKYLDHGIPVCVNTDNPGISDTGASRELLNAARMTRDGLSRWDVMRLVRNGFKAAFLPRDEKDSLLKEVDGKIFELLLKEL